MHSRIVLIGLILVLGLTVIFSVNAQEQMNDAIRDLQVLPQEPEVYLKSAIPSQPLLGTKAQYGLAQSYLERYFEPWTTAKTSLHTAGEVFWAVQDYRGQPVYGENKCPRDSGWLEQIIAQADLTHFPNAHLRAITLRNANLRALPTNLAHYDDFNLPGSGFPFDNFQYSAIAANTPVLISHRSKDGVWVLLETSWASGWVQASDVAVVDDRFVKEFQTGNYIALIKDNVAVWDDHANYRFKSGIGEIFPMVKRDDRSYRILVGVADAETRAVLRQAILPAEKATLFPYPITPQNLAQVAGELIGQIYGWGGLFESRDCSAMTRDILAPFGIWLHRDAGPQAGMGHVTDLAKLTPAAKEAKILQEGVPFVTLIGMPGHIMLYLGEYQGRAVVMHNLWAIRVLGSDGREGRKIVGKTVITTLQPGIELKNIALPKGDLLNRINTMSVLVP